MPISFKNLSRLQFARFAVALLLLVGAVSLTGCGDVYRSIATPVTSPGGDPQATHYALVISQGNLPAAGSVAQIDVSGDTNLLNRSVGVNPVFAAFSGGIGTAWIVNHDESTVSTFSPSFSGGSASSISLEQNSGPTYVALGGTVAVVNEPNLNKVAILSAGQNLANAFVPVGVLPIAITVTPDGKKAFVANNGDNTVTVVSTVENNVIGSPIPVGAKPIDLTIQGAGAFAYLISQAGNSLSVIDTTTNTEVQRVTTGLSAPSRVFWDENLKRVYVVNGGANSITIYNASNPGQLVFLKTVTTAAPPIGLAVLDNGSKFYVLHAGTPGTVEVFDALSFALRTTITVQNNPTSIAAAPGSTKIFVANKTGDPNTPALASGSISIIKSLDESVLNISPAGPNPVFVITQ